MHSLSLVRTGGKSSSLLARAPCPSSRRGFNPSAAHAAQLPAEVLTAAGLEAALCGQRAAGWSWGPYAVSHSLWQDCLA